ncbi:hypothetical protein QFC21_005904 [Naganishia friedmannii]|uniref:Uncharacterized protein n=1 Tax=Naganishia friedmannii TaxID=89922 RepID=A0ACC2V6R6_9TREE|nr:hypothetical protein QFC21_005904 [Naganishia friedmannii]
MIGIPPPPVCHSGPRSETSIRRRRESKIDEIFGAVLKRARAEAGRARSEQALLEDDYALFFTARPPSPDELLDTDTQNLGMGGAPSPPAHVPLTDWTLLSPPTSPFHRPLTGLDSPRNDSPADATHDSEATLAQFPNVQPPLLPAATETPFRELFDDDDEDDDAEQGDQDHNVVTSEGEVRDDDNGLFGIGIEQQDGSQEESDEESDEETYQREWSAYLSRHTTEEERVKLVAQAILSTRLSQEDHNKLQRMPGTHFEEGTFISEHRIRQELNKETGLVATLIDCCANGCMAFTGTYSTGFHCVLCKRARWRQSTPTANKRTTTYYPSHANAAADADIRRYLNLSLRDNKETKLTGQWLSTCDNAAERTHVQVEMGINGESILYAIDSISFPWSFPVDIMHVLFENIIKALLSSWAGTYKMGNITEGDQERLKDDFVIGDRTAAWKAMSREVAGSNGLVPSSIASRVQDLDARGWWTAETHCYFLLFLGPIVLKNRLQKQYFLHFLRLSDIARTITKIEIKTEELEGLRRKIAQWVLDYER